MDRLSAIGVEGFLAADLVGVSQEFIRVQGSSKKTVGDNLQRSVMSQTANSVRKYAKSGDRYAPNLMLTPYASVIWRAYRHTPY